MRSKKFIAALTAVALTFSAMTFTAAADESASETGETSTSETTAPASESSSDDTTTSTTTAPASESGSEDGTTTSVTGDDTTASDAGDNIDPSETTAPSETETSGDDTSAPEEPGYVWEHEDFDKLPGESVNSENVTSGIQFKKDGNDIYAYSASGSTTGDTIRFKIESTEIENEVLDYLGLIFLSSMNDPTDKISITVTFPTHNFPIDIDLTYQENTNAISMKKEVVDEFGDEFIITINNMPAGAYINFKGLGKYLTVDNTETEPETTETTAPAATAPVSFPTAPAVTAAATTTAAAETASVIPASSTEEAVSAISEAAANSTVTLSLKSGSTTVSKDIISAAAGKDVEVKFELDNGVSWSINGQDITDAADIDLGITLNTKTVPEEQAQTVAAGNDTFQFSLDHDGEFGFKAVLNIPVEEKYNGKYAYLYWFHDNKFDYMGSSEVKDGSTALVMDHASDYIMVFGEAEDYNVNVAAGMTALEREIASANTKTTVPAIPAGIAVVTAALGVSALILKKKSSK